MTRYIAGHDSVEVFLDGELCRNVVECDDELGFVIRLKRPLKLNEACDSFLSEVILGRVVVVRTMRPTLAQARGRK